MAHGIEPSNHYYVPSNLTLFGSKQMTMSVQREPRSPAPPAQHHSNSFYVWCKHQFAWNIRIYIFLLNLSFSRQTNADCPMNGRASMVSPFFFWKLSSTHQTIEWEYATKTTPRAGWLCWHSGELAQQGIPPPWNRLQSSTMNRKANACLIDFYLVRMFVAHAKKKKKKWANVVQ